jgi:hypothetical protein
MRPAKSLVAVALTTIVAVLVAPRATAQATVAAD